MFGVQTDINKYNKTGALQGVETDDRKSQWLEDAENAIGHKAFGCARAIFAHSLTAFPSDEEIWLEAAVFEKDHGTPYRLCAAPLLCCATVVLRPKKKREGGIASLSRSISPSRT